MKESRHLNLRRLRSSRKPGILKSGDSESITRPQLGPFFVLKFVRSRVLGAKFLQPFPKSLVAVKCYSSTKIAVNGR